MSFSETPLSRRLLTLRDERGWSREQTVQRLESLFVRAGIVLSKPMTTERLRSYERGAKAPTEVLAGLARLYSVSFEELALTGVPSIPAPVE